MQKKKPGPKRRPMDERFWEKVEKVEGGCWLFGGRSAPNRYGLIAFGGHKTLNTSAHRYSYKLHKGEIAAGMFVCHTCDVRNCVNPDHLYVGTHEQNNQDRIDRNRSKGIGSPLDVRGRYRRGRALLPQDREKLIEEYRSGDYTQTQLAKRYRITVSTVSVTIRGYPKRTNDGGKRRTGHYRRKLQEAAYEEIRSKYASGLHTQKELALEYGVDQTYISAIINRKTRRDQHERQGA